MWLNTDPDLVSHDFTRHAAANQAQSCLDSVVKHYYSIKSEQFGGFYLHFVTSASFIVHEINHVSQLECVYSARPLVTLVHVRSSQTLVSGFQWQTFPSLSFVHSAIVV